MATASPAFVSIEEYLRTGDYEPDADYVDDHIEERPMGELDHSDLQTEMATILRRPENRPYFKACAELRVRVAPRRIRVPDVCLIAHGAPREKVLVTPPILCIEVLSPEDRMTRVMVRVHDFLTMGVPEVWVIDPKSRMLEVCTISESKTYTTETLSIPGTPATVSLQELFQTLDE